MAKSKTKKGGKSLKTTKEDTTSDVETDVRSSSFDPLGMINPIATGEAKEGISTALRLVISALTLVSALAWNDLIKTLFRTIKKQFPEGEGESAELIGLLIYAVLVTIVTVIAITRLKKLRKQIDPDAVDKKK